MLCSACGVITVLSEEELCLSCEELREKELESEEHDHLSETNPCNMNDEACWEFWRDEAQRLAYELEKEKR